MASVNCNKLPEGKWWDWNIIHVEFIFSSHPFCKDMAAYMVTGSVRQLLPEGSWSSQNWKSLRHPNTANLGKTTHGFAASYLDPHGGADDSRLGLTTATLPRLCTAFSGGMSAAWIPYEAERAACYFCEAELLKCLLLSVKYDWPVLFVEYPKRWFTTHFITCGLILWRPP